MEVVYYRVRKGDTVHAILQNIYGKQQFQANRNKIVGHLLGLNPKIKDVNLIYQGDIMVLPKDPSSPAGVQLPATQKAALSDIATSLNGVDETAADMVGIYLGNVASSVGTDFIVAAGHRLNKAAFPLREMVKNYEARSAGDITKGAYSYRRKLHLGNHGAKLGFLEGLVYPNKPKNEVLRIDTRKGAIKTGNIQSKINQAKRVSALSKTGFVAIVGAGLAVSCAEVAVADTARDKNLILVETVASTAVVLGLLLAPTPVGWVAFIVAGAAGAAATMAAGWGAKKLYDQYGNELDLASKTGVSRLCTVDNINKVML